MGHAPDWMRQNMKSTGSGKIASASHRDTGNPFHGKSAVKSPAVVGVEGRGASGGVARFAEGGPVEGADVGFWERFKAGNIDDPSSEAYRRWGQGAREQMKAIDETRESTSDHWNKYKPSEPAPAVTDDTNEASHLQKSTPARSAAYEEYRAGERDSGDWGEKSTKSSGKASKAKDVEVRGVTSGNSSSVGDVDEAGHLQKRSKLRYATTISDPYRGKKYR